MKLLDRTTILLGFLPFDWRISLWRPSDHDIKVRFGPFYFFVSIPYSDAAYRVAKDGG